MKPISPIKVAIAVIAFALLGTTLANAQSKVPIALDFLKKNSRELQVTTDDLSELKVNTAGRRLSSPDLGSDHLRTIG